MVPRAACVAIGRARTTVCRACTAKGRAALQCQGARWGVGLQCEGGRGQWAVSHHRLANQRRRGQGAASDLSEQGEAVVSSLPTTDEDCITNVVILASIRFYC